MAYVITTLDGTVLYNTTYASLGDAPDRKGSLAWDGTNDDVRFCDGTSWHPIPAIRVKDESVDVANGVTVVEQGQFDYETVAASQTDQVLGNTGGVGDFLHRVVCVVTTAGANGVVSIKDGAGSAISIVPASTPIGVYSVELNMVSTSGAWSVTTGSAATAIGIGRFTA